VARTDNDLFSVLVSSSLLAAYSPATFYGAIVYWAGTAIRPIFIYRTWKGWIYECTNPDPIIKVVEACYMKRHEEDLTMKLLIQLKNISQPYVRLPNED